MEVPEIEIIWLEEENVIVASGTSEWNEDSDVEEN